MNYDIFEKIKSLGLSTKLTPGPVEYIVVGLGNPGDEYSNTRHNIGFMTLDYIARDLNLDINKHKFKALTTECCIASKKVLLMKPQTYMNLSGQAVKEAMNFYKIPPENVLIIFDDISLELGKIRIRKKGSHGGHNGIKDIIANLGSNSFPRIKIGIGNKSNIDYDLKDFVLSPFSSSDMEKIKAEFTDVFSALKLILNNETDKAMNLYN